MLKKGIVTDGEKWRERAVAIRAFERLSDHQLADIGIPRAQIREVVEGLVGRNGHPRKNTGTTTAEVSASIYRIMYRLLTMIRRFQETGHHGRCTG